MREATQWWNEWAGARRPWLLLGDGPSRTRQGEFDLSPYCTVALNGAAKQAQAEVVVVTDAQALQAAPISGAPFVLMPDPFPAENGGTRPLASLVEETPALKAAETDGRLVRCDAAATGGGAAGVIGLLGALGAKHIRTLGVDDGTGPTPDAVREAEGIGKAIQKYDLYCGPLTSEVPARLFLGSDPSQALGAKVLEYSVRRHSTLTTQFDTMQHVHVPMPKDPNNQPRTQFSFHRFAIPKLAGYHGRALYVDADMLTFSDLRELWETPFGDATVLHAPPSAPNRPKQTSVMLLDCDRLSWDVDRIVQDLDAGRFNYEGLMRDMLLEPPGAVQEGLPIAWNSLEEYVPGQTRLIHYTDMKYQPWVSRRNANGALWIEALKDALADGFVTPAEVRQAVRDGYVRPSLVWQIRVRPERWPLFLKTLGPALDLRYKPHRGLRKRLSKAKIGIS